MLHLRKTTRSRSLRRNSPSEERIAFAEIGTLVISGRERDRWLLELEDGTGERVRVLIVDDITCGDPSY